MLPPYSNSKESHTSFCQIIQDQARLLPWGCSCQMQTHQVVSRTGPRRGRVLKATPHPRGSYSSHGGRGAEQEEARVLGVRGPGGLADLLGEGTPSWDSQRP